MTARELYDALEQYVDTATTEDYTDIYNLVIDYENDTQDFDLDEYFSEFLDEDELIERIKYEADSGVERLYYFLGDTNVSLHYADFWKLNAYGNLDAVDDDEIRDLVNDIREYLEQRFEDGGR